MRSITFLILIVISPFASAKYGDALVSEVVRNYDGDTITVNVPQWPAIIGEKMNIRVRGVDTPEIRSQCDEEKKAAIEARDFVSDLLSQADQVIFRDVDRGSFFRIVATVEVDEDDLAAILIEEGLGAPYQDRDQVECCEQ